MWQRRIFLSVFLSPSGPRLDSLATHLFPAAPGPAAGGRPSGPHRVLYPYQKVSSTFATPPPYTPSTIFFYFIIRPDLRRVRLLPSPLERERGGERGLCLTLFSPACTYPPSPLSLSLVRHSWSLLLLLPSPLLHFYTSLFEKRFASRLTKKLESRIDTKKRFFSLSLFLRVFI